MIPVTRMTRQPVRRVSRCLVMLDVNPSVWRCLRGHLINVEQSVHPTIFFAGLAPLELGLLAQHGLAAHRRGVQVGHDLLARPVVGGEDHVKDSVTGGVGDPECQGCFVSEVLLQPPAHEVCQLGAELGA